MRNHGDEGWDSKIGEDTVSECAFSNTFYAIVKTNGTLKRGNKGFITNPPGEVAEVGILIFVMEWLHHLKECSPISTRPSHSSTSVNLCRW